MSPVLRQSADGSWPEATPIPTSPTLDWEVYYTLRRRFRAELYRGGSGDQLASVTSRFRSILTLKMAYAQRSAAVYRAEREARE